MSGATTAPPADSVLAYARHIQPNRVQLDDWLDWPPDVFALTSLLLKTTGAYRRVLDDDIARTREQQRAQRQSALAWVRRVNTSIDTPAVAPPARDVTDIGRHALVEACDAIEQTWSVCSMEELRVLRTPAAARLAKGLLCLHAIADEACAGIGLPGGLQPWNALFHLVANLLLAARGTIATIPKHHGVVLPKMRTPQSGLTLRSLSHHLTCHTTEVEVVWRAMPWINLPRDTVNILAIPDPPEVTPRCFEAGTDTLEAIRYFTYEPSRERACHTPGQLAALVERTSAERGHVHVVVLPELALDEADYQELLLRLGDLSDRGRLAYVPMVVTGVRASVEPKSRPGAASRPGRETENEVHLAAYFAGRWYKMSQRKHHRWRLDRNQIRQYGFESRLSTTFAWFERIAIAQRRLSFLAATDLLVLCPLICEDLAQLEPVSEVIRGVGPTLLTALLMDGPQLEARWSARYASVFADDPGTAVLTLTSLGMSSRSTRREAGDRGADRRRDVALWRDPESGTRVFSLPDAPSPANAFLLTVSATTRTEYAADGRVDGGVAGVFRFDGAWTDLRIPAPESPSALPDSFEMLLSNLASAGPDWHRELVGDWEDLRGLSVAFFALDAMMELGHVHVATVKCLSLGETPPSWVGALRPSIALAVDGIVTSLRDSGRHGGAVHGETTGTTPTTPTLELSAELLAKFFADEVGAPMGANDVARIDHYVRLADRAMQELPGGPVRPLTSARLDAAELDRVRHERIRRAVPRAVLVAVHQRLQAFRGQLLENRTTSGQVLEKESPVSGLPPSPSVDSAAALRLAGETIGRIERVLGLAA
jgi:hypothetical protein